jgi:hypothetical protein
LTHWIVWNNAKTEGFATTDQQLAYEVRKCAETNCCGNELALMFCHKWGDEDCTTEEVPTMQPYIVEGLRALRLHHWQAVLRLREYAADADMRKSDSEHYNKRANFHLTQVQLLNDFFPIGDTAEHDNVQLPPKV